MIGSCQRETLTHVLQSQVFSRWLNRHALVKHTSDFYTVWTLNHVEIFL